MQRALGAAAARVRRLSSAAAATGAAPVKNRRRARVWGAAAAATAIAAASATQQHHHHSHAAAHDALLTLRLGALLGAALYDSEAARQQHHETESSSDAGAVTTSSSSALNPVAVVRDALAAATQLLALIGDAGHVSGSHDLQSRVAELLAEAAVDAGSAGRQQQLRTLVGRGLVDALLQFLASARPPADPLLQKMVQAIEELVTLAAVDTGGDNDAGLSSALGISLDTLGAAFGHLVDAQALRFTDLLRVGDLLCRAQQQQQSQFAVDAQQRRHFAVSRRGSALRAGDESATRSLATGLRGFFRLLSPEMPSSIKQFALWALTAMLRTVEQLPPGAQAELVESFLSPKCAALITALPRGNQTLQLQAASFLDVVLHLAQQHPALAQRSAYELWMKQIRHWTASPTSSPALQIESAQCLRTLSSHPLGRLYMSESPATMEALYHLARRLHERVAKADRASGSQAKAAQASNTRRYGRDKQTRRELLNTPPVLLAVGDAVAMQRHVSRAVRNICTSHRNGEAALTSSSSTSPSSSPPSSPLLLLHSKRNLPMSRVFRGAQDLSDLPVVGAEEYESSTEVGWIDILTSWSASECRDVRLSAIESLVHLAEGDESAQSHPEAAAPPSATQDDILQAWLTSMLQHTRHLSGGGEILAVKQVEEIAKLSDGLTPGNETVRFNPAVVDAGAAALAVLVENHHEELIQQGVVPLMALLSQSRHASDSFDLKTQSTRVIANLVASSCALLSSGGTEPTLNALLDEETQYGRRNAWKQFVADHFDVQRMLQQTPSGKRLLLELRQWGQWEDPMRRSSYFRATQNMAAYRAFMDTGRLEKDIYREGVHPIVPHRTPVEDDGLKDSVSATGGSAPSPSLDVVFVHGLRGHPFGTWRTDMGKAVDGKNDIWPDVLLADDLARSHIDARLVTLGYEAGMVSWSSPWPSLTLQEQGKVMLDALYAANIGRSKQADKPAAPVVFVTHSMGGILVKKMLLLASERAKGQREQPEEDDNLATSTKGVVFLAVPHFGSDLAKGMRSDSVRSLIKAHPAIRDLCADPDGRLVELNDAFRYLGIDCMSIGEAKAAPLGLGLSAMVVKAESADPGFGSFHVLADSDHMTICKARSAHEPHYRAILRFLVARCRCDSVADEAPAASSVL